MSTDTPDSGGQNGGGTLPDSVVAEVLESPRRRRMLAVLFSEDGSVPVIDLARRVAAAERDCDPSEVSEEAVEDVKADIYATHLPKLTALRVVDFDSLLASVEPAESAPETRDRLDNL